MADDQGILRSISKGLGKAASGWHLEDVFTRSHGGSHDGRSSRHSQEDEEALRWAALEKLPTCSQNFIDKESESLEEIHDIFFEENLEIAIDKVGISLPTVEVRFQNLCVEADCHVGDRALPTLTNSARNIIEGLLASIGISFSEKAKLGILKDASGILKPGRTNSYVTGWRLSDGAAIIWTAALSGIGGSRLDNVTGACRTRKDSRDYPKRMVDLFMKATVFEGDGVVDNFTTLSEYILGLDVCRDTFVGDQMRRGISGGQKKRVTTGEMLVGPAKTLFMDEISTGLDSSTTFQIVKCMQQIAHLNESTIFMSLLQPAPETFELFDDIVLLSEGQIVYQGPREHIVEFFESCGFRCPERKGTADFLQEVTSKKDQEQYWVDRNRPYRYIPVREFSQRFKNFHVGQKLHNELSVPYDKNESHKAALVFKKYLVPKRELLKACWDKEVLLMKRNTFIYVFKSFQIIFIAFIVTTLYLKPTMHHRNEIDGSIYIGAILCSLLINMFNGYADLSFAVMRLPVIYKQRDLMLHPPWTFTVPSFLLRIPISLIESVIWTIIVYWGTGLAPDASRFFKHLLLVFLIQNVAAGLFKSVAGVCKTMNMANTGGSIVLILVFILGGFILPRTQMPNWLEWAYWISPLSYSFKAFSNNEFLASRWTSRRSTDNSTNLGFSVLKRMDVPTSESTYWINAAALLGFICLFNILFTLSLMYMEAPGKRQAIISKEEAAAMDGHGAEASSKGHKEMQQIKRTGDANGVSKKGMVLPFIPLAMSFDNINYYVDMPSEMKEQGVTEDRLQLLRDVTGAFRPGVLTSLMGVSGAGKTTLMDVLAGRKTGGYIEGDIRISGFPKVQETFARISGYCEQNDIHSPTITIHESLIFSAFLRLPKEVSPEEKMIFVQEVMELVELDNIKKDANSKDFPGVYGIVNRTEERG
ncbi:ABC transporter G family member 35-like protein [Tanacetum coccineum]